jgi:hypothetical protein
MAELRLAKGTGRLIGSARRRLSGTGSELALVTPSSLDKEPGGETSSGRVVVLAREKKTWRGNGLEKLEKAADRRLGQASEALADLLLDKAKDGKVEGLRLMVTLAEHRIKRKPEEKKKKKRSGPSWAELLASEPEYVREEPEVGDVWTGDGWRKISGRIVTEGTLMGGCWPGDRPKIGDVWNGDGWKNEKTGKILRMWYETRD